MPIQVLNDFIPSEQMFEQYCFEFAKEVYSSSELDNSVKQA